MSPETSASGRTLPLDPDPILSTTQVGDLFQVHPSTITRWCDRGEISFRRTEGGHRRILLSDALAKGAEECAASSLLEFGSEAGSVWQAEYAAVEKREIDPASRLAEGWIDQRDYEKVRDMVVYLGRRNPAILPLLLDGVVRTVMAGVGGRWEDGRIGVGNEHLASEMMSEALFSLRMSWSRELEGTRHGGVAIVGCSEGERHALGARGIRLLLEQKGWKVRFLGADVPVDEWARLQAEYTAELVCISFSSIRASGDVRRISSSLTSAYDPAIPYALALGGGMVCSEDGTGRSEPEQSGPFLASGVFGDASEFLEWIGDISWPHELTGPSEAPASRAAGSE